MNIYIAVFLIAGACFGLATFSFRHLFSEGPHQIDTSLPASSLASRAFWIMVCTFLWPLMVLTGIHSAWVLAKRKRQHTTRPGS